jgi:hypothetical protein
LGEESSLGEHSLRTRFRFGLWIALGSVVVIELFSYSALRITQHEWFSPSEFRHQRQTLAGQAEEKAGARELTSAELTFVPHPYLGYVANPAVTNKKYHWWIGSPGDPFAADPEALFVLILGGSVANNLRSAWKSIEQGLREYEPYRDRNIVYANLAGAGYKQPQQLIALTYYLALGGKADVLINLDGFNDVVSGIQRNLNAGVYPHYPSYWTNITQNWTQPAALAAVYESSQLRMKRKQFARCFESLWFSATANLVWKLLDTRIETQIYRLNVDNMSQEEMESPIHSRGPQFDSEKDDDQVRHDAVALWARSSRMLAGIAREHGFAYFHFLQPNQYVPGSKTRFSAVEQSSRVGRPRYQKIVPPWYSELQKTGASLKRDGVAFFDLVAIYRDVPETVYGDDCCHLTALGREIMAREITRRIVEELRASPGASSGTAEATEQPSSEKRLAPPLAAAPVRYYRAWMHSRPPSSLCPLLPPRAFANSATPSSRET